jgi:hypothetical protein
MAHDRLQELSSDSHRRQPYTVRPAPSRDTLQETQNSNSDDFYSTIEQINRTIASLENSVQQVILIN